MSDAGINWADIDVMSDAGINWADINVMSDAGINWADIDVMSDAGINWADIDVMSDAGINWADLDVMSDAGINWADLDVMSDAGINWADLDVMSDAGVKLGIPSRESLLLSAQTVLGAAKLLLESGEHPAELRGRIATPAGTTIEGLIELERKGIRSAVIDAVLRASERARELTKGSP